MRVAVYARVSTADKDQDPETQLLPLREFVGAQRWELAGEFVDRAPAGDLRGRRAWRELLQLASRRRVDTVLVWRIDRAFRSVRDAAATLEQLRGWGVGIRSYEEPFLDTTSPFGEFMYHVTSAFAQLERSILRDRVRAGMARARAQGRRLGRPRVLDRQAVAQRWAGIRQQIVAGEISRRKAAKQLRVGEATVRRLLSERG